MAETTDHKVGDYHFTDSNGLKRYHGRGCNLYGSPDDALTGFRRHVRRSARVVAYVWRTVDGLYDCTATPDANDGRLPELKGAELVREVPI